MEYKLCETCLHYNRTGYTSGCSKLGEWAHAWIATNLPDWIKIKIVAIFEPPKHWYCKEWEQK